MRLTCSLSDYSIIQAEKSPANGVVRGYSGKFAIPVPSGASVNLDSSSYVSPIDGGDVSSLAYDSLLAQYPMYSNIVFNNFLLPADMAALDTAAVYTPTGDITRAQLGRGAGPLPTGASPNTVAILGQNNRVAPARPGILVSDTINIGPLTGGLGADEFMVFWHIVALSNTHDVSSDYGMSAGDNTPAERRLAEAAHNPSGFTVHLSHDDGGTYTTMSRLVPTDFGSMGTLLRIAFRNTGTSNRYLAGYAIIF